MKNEWIDTYDLKDVLTAEVVSLEWSARLAGATTFKRLDDTNRTLDFLLECQLCLSLGGKLSVIKKKQVEQIVMPIIQV